MCGRWGCRGRSAPGIGGIYDLRTDVVDYKLIRAWLFDHNGKGENQHEREDDCVRAQELISSKGKADAR